MGHIDIKIAFLNGDIDREVYVTHPMNLPRDMRSNAVYQLSKSLYGLHQSSLQWFTKLKNTLMELGYTNLIKDIHMISALWI